MAKSRRPKVNLKPIGDLIEAKKKELQVLHDSGKLTKRQMDRVKSRHLPDLDRLWVKTRLICSDHWWHEHDPWFCPAPDSKTEWFGELFGKVPMSKRLVRRRKK
jgi:hypothetical protein